MFLEDRKWQEADNYCEKVLDRDPKNAKAYLGKLMADLYISCKEKLKEQKDCFDENENFKKAIRFSDEELKSELEGYIAHIKDCQRQKKEQQRKIENLKKLEYDKKIDQVANAIMIYFDGNINESYKNAISDYEQNILNSNNEIERLKEIKETIPNRASEIQSRKSIQNNIENKIKSLETEYNSLGAFSKKRRKEIEEEIIVLNGELNKNLCKIEKQKKDFFGGNTDEIETKISELEKTIINYQNKKSAIETKLNNIDNNKIEKISFEKAKSELSDEKLSKDVLSRYPELQLKLVKILIEYKNNFILGTYKGEPISWQVCYANDNFALVVTTNGIDTLPFDDDCNINNWDRCMLNKYLNNEMFNEMFNDKEKELILFKKLFVFDSGEIEKHLSIYKKISPTKYAKDKGAFCDQYGYTKWWTSTSLLNDVVIVNNNGSSLDSVKANCEGITVRPACRIDLSKL